MSEQKLVHKNQRRKALAESMVKVKSTRSIEYLLKLSELYRRMWDDEEYKDMSDDDYHRVFIINNVLAEENIDWSEVRRWFNVAFEAERKKVEQ